MRIFAKRLIVTVIYWIYFTATNGNITARVGSVTARFKVDGLPETLRARRHERPLIQGLIEEIKSGDVIWDIGANIGVHSIFCAVQVGSDGQIFAFEPEPNLIQKIETSIKRNSPLNISIVPVALGDSSTTANLYIDPSDGSGKHTLQNRNGFLPLEVKVKPGDDLITQGSVSQPNIVKIDVEGYELGVLRGMTQALSNPELRYIVVEVHPIPIAALGEDEKDVRRLLELAGFTEYSRSGRGREHHLIARR